MSEVPLYHHDGRLTRGGAGTEQVTESLLLYYSQSLELSDATIYEP